jgi:adenosine deaminase
MPHTSEDTLDQIRRMPKAELHLHLTGAYPLSYLSSIAVDPSAQALYKNFVLGLQTVSKGVTYHEVFKYFAPVEKLVNTYEKVENGVVAIAEELIADGVIYVEIRAGLKDLGRGGYEEYLRAILRGIARCPAEIKIKVLLSLRRDTSEDLANKTVDLAIRYKDQGVVGIDISGESTLGEIAIIIPAIQRAKNAALFLTLHLGESLEEINFPEKELAQAAVLELLKPDRIGHGVFLSPQALAWVLSHPLVPIEVCPTSSVLAGMVDHHSNHPGPKYYLQHDHPIVGGTDDPLLFQSPLSKEYRKLMDIPGIGINQILQMILWSFDFAFLSQQEKLELRARFNAEFTKSSYPRPRSLM